MPPAQTREESWNSLHHSEASGDNGDDGYSDAAMEDEPYEDGKARYRETSAFPTVSDVQRALHPLQATADRVGKQVELFAENLDRLSVKKQQGTRKDCRHVLPMVNACKKIANDTVRHLETLHAPERHQRLSTTAKRSFRRYGMKDQDHGRDDDSRTTVEDLKYWEQEEQTWDLVGTMLQVEFPISEPAELQNEDSLNLHRPPKDRQVHHYSPETDIWKSFLATDDQAWERHTVLQWLQKSADTYGQDVEQVVQELESGADRGSGLWAHSWLYSKEAIKGQKRLRTWPKALEPDSPGLDVSHLNREKTEALVTQLDPDAITRQNRSLEKQDKLFERATWLACWEMLKRGKDWDHLQEWCAQRVENWRAMAMHGDPRTILVHSSSRTNWRSRALWRKTCALAAKEGGIDEYENAVYGVLSGFLPSVLKVSRCWDEHVFAYYNSYLLQSFNRYISHKFPERVPSALKDQHSSFNFSISGGQRVQSGNQLMERLRNLDQTKEEARSPFKMLQGSLIAKAFDDFVFRHGAKLARSANTDTTSKILKPLNKSILEGTVTADISMADHDLLRLMTHLILIYQDVGYDFGEGDRRYAMEGIIVAYVDYLSKAGKQQLLPLYASRLSNERSITCLGRQLPFILDREERQTFLRLMTQEGIDVPAVLNMQLKMIIADGSPQKENGESPPSHTILSILEKTHKDSLTPRPIRSDFIGNEVTDDQQDLIHGFEWYLLLDGHWHETMMTGSVVYKYLLRIPALAAARSLCQEVPFRSMSLSKTQAILGQITDISRDEEMVDGEEDVNDTDLIAHSRYAQDRRRRRSSSLKRYIEERDILLEQASTFRDFENLCVAIDAMEKWKTLADNHINSRQPGGAEWKKGFQEAYSQVESSVKPLLHNWLQDPQWDVQAVEFGQIRVGCLPEVVLAYITVLEKSSRFLSRDLLLKGMDLAALIAAEDSDLAECFMTAGRMAELVDAFASLSKTMIQADNLGGKGAKGKKRKNGETLSLWSIRTPSPGGLVT